MEAHGSFTFTLCVAARVFLIRCYAKNVKTDLTADEKKQLR